MTKLYEFSFRNNRITPMRRDYRLGGIVSFLKNSERSSNIATLICMNYMKIQKLNIKLNGKSEESNGTIVFLNDKEFRIILDTNIKKTTIGESDRVTDEHEYNSHDLEPWNQNNSKRVIGKFLNNDKSALLITGQNSIQVWKPKSKNFKNLNDFKNFENSNLVYILIIEHNYLNSLYYKPCFGEMKYNFSSNIFQTLANKDTLKVYVPLTRLIPINSFNIFNYATISDDILSDIYMVPLPNFTTYDPKIKAKTGIVYFLRKILFPPGYKNLDNNKFSSFLKIEKKKAIEFSQMKKYKSNYFTLFNILDLSSIVLGMFNFTLILIFNGNYGEWIILAASVTTLILWIELLLLSRLFSIMAINIFIFGNILKIIIPFFGFMLILTIGFGHSMFVLFGHPSFTNLNPSNPTFTLKNGNETENLTLTETNPDNPFDTMWNAILSTYYWSTLNLNVYEYWPLKLLFFLAHVTLVLVLLNMIIALMNGEFNKAKEDDYFC
uniref:Ion transport domain-containing protein n=1 Tax=Rhizophagus irregularis (strain DAOM 181602 / DAOM 197198 / MUCL 43194) TaxID=747089 RepID=U9UK10_RHIID